MNTNIKTAAKLAALAGAFALTGCAFVPDTVHPTYTPPASVTKIPGADKVVVDVVVKNEKTHKNGQISWSKNGYDMDTAGVYMHVKKDFKKAIDKALRAYGFRLGANEDRSVDVVVHKFFIHEENDFSGISDVGYSNISVIVRNKYGNVLFARNFNKNMGKLQVVQAGINLKGFTTGGRHEAATTFLDDVVNQITSNNGFLRSLVLNDNSVTGHNIQRNKRKQN